MLLVLAYLSCTCVPRRIQYLIVNAPTAVSFYIVEFYKFVLGECMKPAHICNIS